VAAHETDSIDGGVGGVWKTKDGVTNVGLRGDQRKGRSGIFICAKQPWAMYQYGQGVGVEQDLKEAFKWYQKAADQGDAAMQNYLDFWKRK
jgi:hypothetical protein